MVVFHRSCLHSRGPNRLLRGRWSFYLPAREIKLPYSDGGFLACRSKNAPLRAPLLDGSLDHQTFAGYDAEEWKKAYQTSCLRRTVENYVITERLHRAGLGPKTHGFVHVRHCAIYGFPKPTANYGIRVQNVNSLPTKAEASEQDLINAGVLPDKTKSCMRQQVNGYILDLNSASGVQAIDADDEIEELMQWLVSATS
ncbi:MAG: hypothetical protein ACQCXQ_08940 [Verrucomicrobiales bacterium]|nr:hypothetical protein [Verrucomicrobiota bacterium JB025]